MDQALATPNTIGAAPIATINRKLAQMPVSPFPKIPARSCRWGMATAAMPNPTPATSASRGINDSQMSVSSLVPPLNRIKANNSPYPIIAAHGEIKLKIPARRASRSFPGGVDAG